MVGYKTIASSTDLLMSLAHSHRAVTDMLNVSPGLSSDVVHKHSPVMVDAIVGAASSQDMGVLHATMELCTVLIRGTSSCIGHNTAAR